MMNYKNPHLKRFILCYSLFCIFSINALNAQTGTRPVDPLIEKFLDPGKYPGMMIAAHRTLEKRLIIE